MQGGHSRNIYFTQHRNLPIYVLIIKMFIIFKVLKNMNDSKEEKTRQDN